MSPRRKKVEGEARNPERSEAESKDLLAPSGLASSPKKKRTTRKKAAPAPDAGAVSASLGVPAKAAFPAIPTPALKPASPPPMRITIEPDDAHLTSAEPAPDTDEDAALWKPARKNDPDLSTPPSVLLQSKKPVKTEVEDILEDVEEDEGPHVFARPPVRSGMFRRIAVGFGLLVVVLALLVGYVTYAQATIVVHPRRGEVRTERVLSVVEDPSGSDEVPGEIEEITVAGEKNGAPTGSSETDAVATGFATLINTTGNNQTLVATTRLLTDDGVLFRLKSKVVVPARGQIKTEVYADKAGKASEIGPSKFTIPGLSADLRPVIYAESDAAMTGGAIASGVASAEDIAKVENELRAELADQAKNELAKRSGGSEWTGDALLIETMSKFVNVAPGESTSTGILVRLSLRVREVRFDRAKAVLAAVEDLRRGLTSDRELVSVNGDSADIGVERADPKAGTAMLRVILRGESVVSINSPLFDAEKLKGLSLSGVKTYFDAIEGVERVDVKVRPFWLKRMPDLKDHIRFEIEK